MNATHGFSSLIGHRGNGGKINFINNYFAQCYFKHGIIYIPFNDINISIEKTEFLEYNKFLIKEYVLGIYVVKIIYFIL